MLLLILISAFLTSDVFSLIYLQRSVFWKVGEKRVWNGRETSGVFKVKEKLLIFNRESTCGGVRS